MKNAEKDQEIRQKDVVRNLNSIHRQKIITDITVANLFFDQNEKY